MSFVYKKGYGTQQIFEDLKLSNVSVVKGEALYSASGYCSNAYGSFRTYLMRGVANQTVDNSGGSAGDKLVNVDVCPLSIYLIDTADTATQATEGTNVACAAAGTLTSLTPATGGTGVVKIVKFISSSKVLGMINFWSPSDS